MKKIALIMLGSIVAAGLMFWMMSEKSGGSRAGGGSRAIGGGQSITVFCAASNRAVMERVREAYEAESGIAVNTQYGPSQTLLSSLEVSDTADLYLPADSSFLDFANEKNLVEEILPIATMHAVIAVKRGNPQKIHTFDDLLRSDVKLVQANPDASAIGKITRKVLRQQGLWDKLDKATRAYRTTVTDGANDILIGAADAAIVYDAVLHTYPDLEYIELEEFADTTSEIQVGVVASSKQPQAALHFARYLTAEDRGLELYREFGFKADKGDTWADKPQLSIFAGSMLRPAIEETILKFEEREGVSVARVYNGCGILVAQMKAGQHPDAYFACDSEFMTQVADLFPQPVEVSQNELAILVEKGNPFKISSLRDLTREGVRVGIGHEKQCAMGWLTQNTFNESGMQSELMENVRVQSPTGDMLVNQLRAGSLDAAVAYLSNAAGMAEHIDAIRIEGLSCSIATQPWAVAEESAYPLLASRLFERICSTDSQDAFAAEGFRWQLKNPSQTGDPAYSAEHANATNASDSVTTPAKPVDADNAVDAAAQ